MPTRKELYANAKALKTKNCPPISKMTKAQLVKYIAGRSVAPPAVKPAVKAKPKTIKIKIKKKENIKKEIEKIKPLDVKPFLKSTKISKKVKSRKTIKPEIVKKMKAKMPQKKQPRQESKWDDQFYFKGVQYAPDPFDKKMFMRIRNNIEGYEKDLADAGELRLTKSDIREIQAAIKKQMASLQRIGNPTRLMSKDGEDLTDFIRQMQSKR